MEDRLDPAQKQREPAAVRLGLVTGFCLALVILAHPAVADRSMVAIGAVGAVVVTCWWSVANARLAGGFGGGFGLLTWSLAGFWLLALLGSASVNGTWQLHALLPPVLSISLLWVGAHLGQVPRATRWLLLLLVAAAAGAAIHGAVQHVGLDPLPRLDEFGGRVVGPFRNPNHLGSLAALAVPVALSGFLALCSRAGSFRTVAGIGAGGAVLTIYSGLLLAGSRGAIWAAIGGATIVVCSAARSLQRQSRQPAWLPLLLLVASLVLVTRLLQERPIMEGPKGEVSVGQRLQAMSNMTGTAAKSDLTVIHRKVLWRGAWDLFLQKPLLGVGPGGYQQAFGEILPQIMDDPGVAYLSRRHRMEVSRYAHNEWLHRLAEVGLVGTIGWSLLVALPMAGSLRRLWRGMDGMDRAALGGCTTVLIHSLVSYPMYLPGTAGCFWLLLGLVASRRSEAPPNLS